MSLRHSGIDTVQVVEKRKLSLSAEKSRDAEHAVRLQPKIVGGKIVDGGMDKQYARLHSVTTPRDQTGSFHRWLN